VRLELVVEAIVPHPEVHIVRMSASALFLDHEALWFVTAEQSFRPPKPVSISRLDPETGALTAQRTALLPGGLCVHAITAHRGRVFLGGTVSGDGGQPTII
jgi:hypothetical protein